MDGKRGIIVAVLTPFLDGTTDVDWGSLESQLELVGSPGVVAVSVVGVETQEFQVLDDDTRVAVVERAVRSSCGVPVIAGVSSPSLPSACSLAARMADAGASGVLAIAGQKPWGAPPTSDEAVRWFTRIADASPLPVTLYNNPRLGVDLSPECMAQICAHDNVGCVKETSRDGQKLLRLVDLDRRELAAVYTNMELLLPTLVLGGSGAMLPLPGLPMASRIANAFLSGDLPEAAEAQAFFAEFPARWMSLGLAPVMKAACALMGCTVGGPLTPYEPLAGDDLQSLKAYLEAWKLLGIFERRQSAEKNRQVVRG
jgi:4-hydroxy-tetrahydrodipicolinate synthase